MDTPPKFRKLRADSTFSSLAAGIKHEVDEMLLAGVSYRKVREYLLEAEVTLSLTAIGEYYTSQLLPLKWRRQSQVASALESLHVGDVDAATMSAVKQRVFELATQPAADPKEIKSLYELVLKSESLAQDARRLTMLEDRAQQAKELAEQALAGAKRGGLSPEAMELIQEKLNLL